MLSACSDGDAQSSSTAPITTSAAPGAASPSSPKRAPNERPIPAFDGTTLHGERVSVSSFLGRRLLLFVFNPEVASARVAGAAVRKASEHADTENFAILGIAVGSSRPVIERFVHEQSLGFPVIDDASGAIGQKLQLRAPVVLIGIDAEGYLAFGFGSFPEGPTAARAMEQQLAQALRLPGADAADDPLQSEHPMAPDFRGRKIDGSGDVQGAALRGKPLLLVFFLHTCPHCHHLLEFLKKHLPTLPEPQRPTLVGISVSDDVATVRDRLRADGLDFFPVLTDPDTKIREAYGVLAGVPDLFVIDAEGRIRARTQGWRDDRDPPLLQMRIAKITGAQIPMLLHKTGYSGNEFCGVCHEAQQDTWLLTNHASAFDTLVKHGAERNGECIGCHVVGWGKPGGYTMTPPARELEDVGCETCHGRGGPHLSPGLIQNADYEAQCVTCHDAKHSLGFRYADRLPRVSHAANAQLAALSPDEKRKVLLARKQPRSDLLPTTAAFVGSQACQSCHAGEHETWSRSAHARSVATLEKAGKAKQSECLKCHTTGFGRTGGFPSDGAVAQHRDRAAVGCESCHGPGGEHAKPDAPKVGNIVSLGDKCDSCVILQICGSCHDAANDPGFEFEVKQKIDAQKHGTKPPAAGANTGPAASVPSPALLEHAFAHADQRSGSR